MCSSDLHGDTPMRLDGEFADWSEGALHRASPWVAVAAQWNQQGLWLAFKVKDTTPRNYQEGEGLAIWKSDCIELYFNPDIERGIDAGTRDAKFVSHYVPGDFQVIAAVRGGGTSGDAVQVSGKPVGGTGRQNPKDPQAIRMVSRRNAGGYTAEILIPWSRFPKSFAPRAGNLTGFSFSVRDVDLHHRLTKRFFWAGNDDNYFNTAGLGVLVLKP